MTLWPQPLVALALLIHLLGPTDCEASVETGLNKCEQTSSRASVPALTQDSRKKWHTNNLGTAVLKV